jgi:hypothetical protein
MTQFDRSEMDFLLRRAQEEMILAIRADSSPAGTAHRRLSLLYSAKALTALAGIDSPFQASGSVRS